MAYSMFVSAFCWVKLAFCWLIASLELLGELGFISLKQTHTKVLGLEDLPEDCIARIMSFTTPRDACAMSLVSTTLKSSAESDVLWNMFIPSEYRSLIHSSSLSFHSKKDLYLYLSENPILIDNGQKSFQLEKVEGKKCYMLSARSLFIAWGDTPSYWKWTSLPNTRFSEVAQLVRVCWFEIKGMIKTSVLSPNTLYGAYLVFKPNDAGSYGFDNQSIEAFVGIAGEGDTKKRRIYLCTLNQHTSATGGIIRRFRRNRGEIGALGLYIHANQGTARRRIGITARVETQPPSLTYSPEHKLESLYSKERNNGWWEVELGDFFNKGGDEKELEMSVHEVESGNWKGDIILQGIEIRPKH